ncbi:MAG: NAD(P)-dependent oxidoreductase [Rubrivivax sp.]
MTSSFPPLEGVEQSGKATFARDLPALKASVIGAAGFIGSHLLRRLRRDGFDAQALPRDAGSWLGEPLGHVFYCAGVKADHAQRAHDTVSAHVSLLNQVLRHRGFESLVYLSSTRLYDGLLAPLADEDTPLALNPLQARHLFDLSKATGEALCHAAGQGLARVARLSCVVHGSADAQGFVPRLLRQIESHAASNDAAAPLRVDSTPHAARDYVLLDDVLSALPLIALRGTQPTYNVASGHNLSNRALFERLGERSGIHLVATQQQPAQPAPRVDIRRMAEEFGWRPRPLLDALPELMCKKAAETLHEAPTMAAA